MVQHCVMSFITVWGFGNVVNNYANQGWWLFFHGCLSLRSISHLMRNCWSVRLDLQRWEGRGQYLVKHTMGPGLAYLAAWTYWVVIFPIWHKNPRQY